MRKTSLALVEPIFVPPVHKRSQRRLRNEVRQPVGTSTRAKVKRWIEREAARYNVSKSFVINNALCFVAGIPVDEDYREPR